MNILFIGDIMGRLGRRAVIKLLPQLKKQYNIDITIANAENSAHGSGTTKNVIEELLGAGVDMFTSGDHAFSNKKQTEVYAKYPIIRPANFPPGTPGQGFRIFNIRGKKIALINLIGRVFMKMDYDCPFRKLDEILANNSLQDKFLSAIILDIHAEATAEKVNLGYYAAGRVSAVIGTHTHIMTADHKILEKKTAYITDVGMVGAADSSLGVEKEATIKTFLTQIKEPFVLPEKGQAILNAVIINIGKKGQAKSIKPIIEYINIE